MFKTGLVSVSFRKYTPEEILKEMQKVNLKYIEWGSDIHAPCDDEEKLEEIVNLQKKYGIICCSYGTYFRVGVNESESIKQYISAAKKLGTDIIRIWCGNKNYEDYSSEEKQALFDECRKITRIAETECVKLCLECHNNTFTNCLYGAVEIMNEIGSYAFRMYWQPNQYRDETTNLNYAKAVAEYTETIHIFNWNGDEKYPLSEACNIWRKYLASFSGNENLLLEFMPDGQLETLKAESRAMFDIVDGIASL